VLALTRIPPLARILSPGLPQAQVLQLALAQQQ
jgi:hypothetical protein